MKPTNLRRMFDHSKNCLANLHYQRQFQWKLNWQGGFIPYFGAYRSTLVHSENIIITGHYFTKGPLSIDLHYPLLEYVDATQPIFQA